MFSHHNDQIYQDTDIKELMQGYKEFIEDYKNNFTIDAAAHMQPLYDKYENNPPVTPKDKKQFYFQLQQWFGDTMGFYFLKVKIPELVRGN